MPGSRVCSTLPNLNLVANCCKFCAQPLRSLANQMSYTDKSLATDGELSLHCLPPVIPLFKPSDQARGYGKALSLAQYVVKIDRSFQWSIFA